MPRRHSRRGRIAARVEARLERRNLKAKRNGGKRPVKMATPLGEASEACGQALPLSFLRSREGQRSSAITRGDPRLRYERYLA